MPSSKPALEEMLGRLQRDATERNAASKVRAETTLCNATDEQLKAELEPQPRPIPTAMPTPDFSKLVECCVSGVQYAAEMGYVDDDLPNYVYEAAMDAVFGDGVFFKWTKERFNQ
jgi:hypothetical protein